MELDFDKTFKVTSRALKLIRCHPSIPRDKKWFLQFTIVHGIFTIPFVVMIYNIVWFNLKMNDFSQTCKNGVLSVVYLVITFQYCVLLWYQDTFVDLIKNINRDYEQSKNLTLEEKDVVFKYLKEGLWVCKQWLGLSICGPGSFIVKSSVLMLYYYYIGEFKYVPLYDMIYPTFTEMYKTSNIFVYLLTYALILVYVMYAAIMYSAFVPLGPIFMLHACAQLELVKKRIDDLFVERDDQVIGGKLMNIIQQQQYIYSFVELINKCLKVDYELSLKGTTIMLPVACYEVLEATKRGEVSIEFMTFIVGATVFSASPCYYSDLLMEKGEDVRLALYTCGWERHYDRRMRTTLQLMLQRALRPIAIQTIFRVLCLDTLTNLFQQSYTLFNLMNAMWN